MRIKVTNERILNIPRAVDINKAHGCDNASIRMVKLCDQFIITRLSIIFQNFIATDALTDTWKKPNIVTVDKNR